MNTDIAKEHIQRSYGYKKIGLCILILSFLWAGLSYAEYGQIKVDRTVIAPTGDDRLLINLIGVSKDGLGYDFHSLAWEKRSSGIWKAYKTITRKEFESNTKHRRWISDAYSLEPETGSAILKVAEYYPTETSNGFTAKYSWRKWDLVNNAEIQFLRECKNAMEPYVLDEKYKTSLKEAKQPSVYIDVINDGDEYAAKIDKAKKPLDVAVQTLGNNLVRKLEERGIVVFTPRNTETTDYLEERVFVARSKSAKLYLALQSSYGKQDCLTISTPSRDERYARLKKTKVTPDNEMSRSLLESIEKAQIDHIVDSSSKFAEMLSSSITASAPSVCIQKQSKKSFILNTADLPSILVDFTAVRNQGKSAYLNNDELKRIIVDALTTTVDDYLRSTMQTNSN